MMAKVNKYRPPLFDVKVGELLFLLILPKGVLFSAFLLLILFDSFPSGSL